MSLNGNSAAFVCSEFYFRHIWVKRTQTGCFRGLVEAEAVCSSWLKPASCLSSCWCVREPRSDLRSQADYWSALPSAPSDAVWSTCGVSSSRLRGVGCEVENVCLIQTVCFCTQQTGSSNHEAVVFLLFVENRFTISAPWNLGWSSFWCLSVRFFVRCRLAETHT